MTREEFWSVFESQDLWLRKYFSKRLKMIGYKASREIRDATINTLILETGIAAYKNSSKDSLIGYSTERLIWVKAKNVFAEWKKEYYRSEPASIADADEWEDIEPDPLEQLIAKEELKEIHSCLPPNAWDVFRHISNKVSYKQLAETYNTTPAAMRAQVYRWRETLRRRFPDRNC